jgi:hypothetical protein
VKKLMETGKYSEIIVRSLKNTYNLHTLAVKTDYIMKNELQ